MRHLIIFFLLGHFTMNSQSLGINHNNETPNANAILDISSSEKGMLIPRMTTTERTTFSNDLTNLETGMMVFDTDEEYFFYWKNGAFHRLDLSSQIIDTDGDTEIRVEETADDDIIRFYSSGLERWRMEGPRLEPTGNNNSILIGINAGLNNDGQFNTIAIGDSVLLNNGIGATGATRGNDNIGIGNKALENNRTGWQNLGIGTLSLQQNIDGSGNLALGYRSLESNTEGNGNSAIGHLAMRLNRTGSLNVAMGTSALLNNISGENNVAIGVNAMTTNSVGENNVAVGRSALSSRSGFSNNVAIGTAAGQNNSISEIVAIGDSSLYRNGLQSTATFQGTRVTAVGFKSLHNNDVGYRNTAVGYESMRDNTSGFSNTAIGSQTLKDNTTGNDNIALGVRSLNNNTTGNDNIGIGVNALELNSDGSRNIAVGRSALASNRGDRNIAVGNQALFRNTTGSGNISLGQGSLGQSTIHNGNVAIGDSTLHNYRVLGTANAGETAIGFRSQFENRTGSNNVSVGSYSLYLNRSGFSNTAMGASTLYNVTGDSNTGVGTFALALTSVGEENTAVGVFALYGNSTRNRRTAIGYSANSLGNNGNNTGIGNDADCTAAHQVRIGNEDVTSIGGYANWTNISDGKFKKNVQENVPGLEFIKSLRPVTYQLDIDAVRGFFMRNYAEDKSKRYAQASTSSTMLRSGFIAQEVEAAALRMGYEFSGVDAPKNDKDYYGLRYAAFVVPLVKAVQEQQKIIDGQAEELLESKSKLEDLERRMATLEKFSTTANNQ